MLLDALAKEGLTRVDEAGVPFDPSVHDAVARAEATEDEDEDTHAEGKEPVIDQVLRSGYQWRGQVLRPAMVSVRG
jgi:molecular chaperone GrpE